jgi:hypothetical protein
MRRAVLEEKNRRIFTAIKAQHRFKPIIEGKAAMQGWPSPLPGIPAWGIF